MLVPETGCSMPMVRVPKSRKSRGRCYRICPAGDIQGRGAGDHDGPDGSVPEGHPAGREGRNCSKFSGILSPCPRVRLIVDLGQMLEIQVSVNLGGADIRVAQEFLHRSQVSGGF